MRTLIIIAAVLYILCPVDVLPDFIPLLGWIDDLFAGGTGLIALIGGGEKAAGMNYDITPEIWLKWLAGAVIGLFLGPLLARWQQRRRR